MHINKWSVLHFPQAEPSFLSGHPGFDHFSGALLHDKTRAVQTLSKVTVMISPVRGSTWFAFDFHINCRCHHLSASENYGKSFQDVTNLINNTFIRSEFGIAIGPENSGKVSHALTDSSGCKFTTFTSCSPLYRCSASVMCAYYKEPLTPYYLVWLHQSEFWTLACRWSWQEKCPEVTGLGSLSPMTLEGPSPTRTCPSSPWCRSHTTLTIPMCCWSLATM